MSRSCCALLLLVLLQAFGRGVFTANITPKQFATTQQMIRNICQARFAVTDEQIEQIKQDLFDEQTQEKCYATCILEMLNLVIDGRIPTELAHMTIQLMLPDEVKDSTVASLERCRAFLPDHPDNVHCIIGHKMFQCMTENNLKVFFV